MRSISPVSSLTAFGVCLMAVTLSGCDLPKGDGADFQRMAAHLAEIDIEGKGADEASSSSDSAAPRDEQIKLVFETAKDLTTGQDGLLAHAPKMQIRVVNPLDMDRPEADTPLDTGLTPEVLVAVAAPAPKNETVASVAPEARITDGPTQTPTVFRTIQVGSFSTSEGAKAAWRDLQARYSGLENFKPVLQPVTTAQGKSMVRLKVGPVASSAQAQRLCQQLDITDSWCTRAS